MTNSPNYPLPPRAIIGVLHALPLPGSPRCSAPLERIIEHSVSEAQLLAEAGYDALIVENFGDAPFSADRAEPHTVAAMTALVRAVRAAVELPLGVNVLRNDARGALAVAAATGAAFIRVNVLTGVYATDQGMIEGRAHELLRYREALAVPAAIFADVHVKHATPISQPDLALAAEETALRGGADALIVTGTTTGRTADLDDADTVRRAVPDTPVLIGSGITPDTIAEALDHADGVIVGTTLKVDRVTTNPIDPSRAKELIARAR